MDNKSLLRIANTYLQFAKGIVDIEKAYLFGSRTTGNPSEDSDIDIGIFVRSLNQDYLSVLQKLYNGRRSIINRIEPHLFIIGLDPSGFGEEIEKSGLPIVV